MKRILAALHLALVSTVLYPVYNPLRLAMQPPPILRLPWRNQKWWDCLPLEEVMQAAGGGYFLKSVIVAGLPAFLALLNLPLILRLKGETGDRWRAFSSLILGFLSTAMMFQLVLRYGYGREWGGIVIWFDSLLLLIAGTAAVARLRPAADPASETRDPVTT